MGDFQFYALFNIILSYLDDGWMIMKGCVQWNLDYGWDNLVLSTSLSTLYVHVDSAIFHHAYDFAVKKYLTSQFVFCNKNKTLF